MNPFLCLGLSHLVGVLVGCMYPGSTLAEGKPLWEVGLGVLSVELPAYRGSMQSFTNVLPIPYLVYRGQYLKADEDGLRGVMFDSDRFEINLNLAASPPVHSSEVQVRHGMPDLDLTLEFGPSIDIKLWKSSDNLTLLNLSVPLRLAMTMENSPKYVGWQFTPRINLDVINPLGLNGWTLGSLAGPVFGSREQHNYFYGVEHQYANSTRSAYDAPAGYAGIQVLTALWKKFPSYWVGCFVRYDNVNGAVFQVSPLVTQKTGFSGGVAVSWILGRSDRLVQVER